MFYKQFYIKYFLKNIIITIFIFNIPYNYLNAQQNIIYNGRFISDSSYYISHTHLSFNELRDSGEFFGPNFPIGWKLCDTISHPTSWNDGSMDSSWIYSTIALTSRPIAKGDSNYAFDYIIQNLRTRILKYYNYKFSAILYSPWYKTDSIDDTGNIYYLKHEQLSLEIWAGNDSCVNEVLLAILHTKYSDGKLNYDTIFENLNDNYSYIKLKVTKGKDTLISYGKYKGEMLVDSVRLVKLLNCDSIHPDDVNETFYYHYFRNVVLEASDGISFDWEPHEDLSSYSIQNPILTAFHNNYTVTIKDKYGCTYHEIFNIIVNCDSLYPSNSILVLDSIYSGTPILLVPKVGNVTGKWTPSNWLSCIDCQTPLASPQFTTTYSIMLIDSFNCKHFERFKIEVNIKVPNVITPNSDGYNDNFRIIGLPVGTSIKIFDKNGYLVFKAESYNETNLWNGLDINGRSVETGTYWYVISNPDFKLLKKGFVFLIR